MLRQYCSMLVMASLMFASVAASAGELVSHLKPGSVDLQSASAIAFAPEGILLVGDSDQAAVFAIATNDAESDPAVARYNVKGLDTKVAAALGAEPGDVLINDLAVNPQSGNVYLSVTRAGADAQTVLLRIDPKGSLSEVSLKDVRFSRADLPNPPAPGGQGRSNLRAQAITDLAFHDGRVIVAGLSNEEFASKLFTLQFPFTNVEGGASVEVFHGAHGKLETRSPVRTFTTIQIEDEPHLIAAYTCTPLVKFPLSELKPNVKLRGVTLAELGNRNRPLDMFVYNKGGKDYILMANSSRGVMKISTDNMQRNDGINEKISDKAGQTYDTIDELTGVVQLDRLNETDAVVLIQTDEGALNLRSVALP